MTPAAEAPGCPRRKLVPVGETTGPALERATLTGDERWVIRSFDAARQVLRESDAVQQAGFGAEQVNRAGNKMRPPVLYLEGAAHRAQRKTAARFFAPKVTEDYRDMMQALSDQLVSRLRTDVPVDLSRLSMTMAVQVAARVVGLTNSSVTGMAKRLDAFFSGSDSAGGAGVLERVTKLLQQSNLLRFYYWDVSPRSAPGGGSGMRM